VAADVAADVGRSSSRCISLIAVNTGRSGQPVQKVGGRGGNSPMAAAAAGLWPTMSRSCAASGPTSSL